jgi:hypothetical protein
MFRRQIYLLSAHGQQSSRVRLRLDVYFVIVLYQDVVQQ